MNPDVLFGMFLVLFSIGCFLVIFRTASTITELILDVIFA